MGLPYDRFWDIHLTANNGWYDFATEIGFVGDYQFEKLNARMMMAEKEVFITPKAPTMSCCVKSPGTLHDPLQLPMTSGYVASVARLGQITSDWKSLEASLLVEWINDPGHVGKVRFNAHGSERGKVSMPRSKEPGAPSDEVEPEDLVEWLRTQGLKRVAQSKGLVTICLDFCYAGKQVAQPSHPTVVRSSVERVAQALTRANLRFIRVTGCTDPVEIRPSESKLRLNAYSGRLKAEALYEMFKLKIQRDASSVSFLRKEAKEHLMKLPKPFVKQFVTLGDIDNQSVDDLETLYGMMSGFPDVENVIFKYMKDQYPIDSKEGQWGRWETDIRDGTEKWVRLKGRAEKIVKVS